MDGAEGKAIYAQRMYEIEAVLLDLMMPVMDGYKCIKTLRKINPSVKVIGTSGLGQNGRHPDIANTAISFLTKPFTTEKLLGALRDVFSS